MFIATASHDRPAIERESLSRRALLRLLGGVAVAACPICAARASGDAVAAQPQVSRARPEAPHWSYQGAGAPENWGRLQSDFRVCDLGMQQSPIDLRGAAQAEVGGIAPSFAEMPLRIVNNGHTIQVNCAPGSFSTITDTRYDLLQFHFHHPSEHILSGQRFELECHFVHRSAAGALAVLGVFIKPGTANAALQPIWEAMPAQEGPERTAMTPIKPAELLPAERSFFRYAGSLTTPPCSEGVNWNVFKAPIEASAAQIRRFAELFPGNARPVQGVNQRFLLESR